MDFGLHRTGRSETLATDIQDEAAAHRRAFPGMHRCARPSHLAYTCQSTDAINNTATCRCTSSSAANELAGYLSIVSAETLGQDECRTWVDATDSRRLPRKWGTIVGEHNTTRSERTNEVSNQFKYHSYCIQSRHVVLLSSCWSQLSLLLIGVIHAYDMIWHDMMNDLHWMLEMLQ